MIASVPLRKVQKKAAMRFYRSRKSKFKEGVLTTLLFMGAVKTNPEVQDKAAEDQELQNVDKYLDCVEYYREKLKQRVKETDDYKWMVSVI